MTTDTGSRGLRLTRRPHAIELVDVRCTECAACTTGRDYWCLDERATGVVLAELDGAADGDLARSWTSALAALAVVRPEPDAVLLVLADVSPGLVGDLVAPWHTGPVLATGDVRDPAIRQRLAELSPTGRAPVVLTVGDVRAAVRAVERGGQVCGPDLPAVLPSVTELVQRDVTLVSVHSIDALVAGSTWAGFADRLDAVLRASTTTGVGR